MIDDLDGIIADLRRRHPDFPDDTVARLVLRTARQVSDQPSRDRLAAVHREADRQLAYAEQIGES